MSDRKDRVNTILDLMEDLKEMYNENEDKVKKWVGSGPRQFSIDDMEPFSEYSVSERMVTIIADTQLPDNSDIEISYRIGNNTMIVDIAGESIEVKGLPEDCRVHDTEYNMVNGVLTIDVPRKTQEEENGTA